MGVAEEDQVYMRLALDLAVQAAAEGEVPVGAVVVRDGQVIGQGWNRPISTCDATAHAEIVALRDASHACGNYRLPGATLYVTIEPCTMCVGAMIHARIARVVFGAPEPKAGALVSRLNLAEADHWNHRLQIAGGVCAEEAADVMRRFFQWRREQARADKPGSA
jgi:tRNA(adenine34) deaminase